MTAPRFIWPVYGFTERRYQRETLAVFFDWSAAADFAMHPETFGAEKRNLYIAEPRYDRRHDILDLEAKRNPDGTWSVAA